MPKDGSATRNRILDVAEELVIDQGFSATSLDDVITRAQTSKGAFFHHFAGKAALSDALVQRYAAADLAHLERALAAVSSIDDPLARLGGFLQFFVDDADDLMSAQSSCLYVAALTEQQLISSGATEPITRAVEAWRSAIAELVTQAAPELSPDAAAALADHVFVTFEGTFLLVRSTGEPGHMRRQLAILRELVLGRCRS